ncbi:hypothetical protein V2I01_33450 [Micromonospora sp. BRA006-A]|nr:hypothetical protein [Micromonospora sp. BRA006-A]
MVALIETARACSPRRGWAPRRGFCGSASARRTSPVSWDFSRGRTGRSCAPIRSQVVVASAAAGITPPVGPVETTLRDPERLERTTRALLGRASGPQRHSPRADRDDQRGVHPHRGRGGLGPRRAGRAGAAERGGSGVATDAGGRLLDRAVVRAAAEVVRRAEASAGDT